MDSNAIENYLLGNSCVDLAFGEKSIPQVIAECLTDGAAKLVEHFRPRAEGIDAVVGYEPLGCVLAWEIARQMGKLPILACDPGGGGVSIIRPALRDVLAGKKVLAVTYLLQPDNTLHRSGFGYFVQEIRMHGAEIAGSAAFCRMHPSELSLRAFPELTWRNDGEVDICLCEVREREPATAA